MEGNARTWFTPKLRVIGVAKILVYGDRCNSLGAKCGDAACYHGGAFTEVLPQPVVKGSDLFGLGRHRFLLNV